MANGTTISVHEQDHGGGDESVVFVVRIQKEDLMRVGANNPDLLKMQGSTVQNVKALALLVEEIERQK